MTTKKKVETQQIDIIELHRREVTFCILGTTPIILNRMAEKAKRELLAPKGRKTSADKAANLKHIPYQEFRASPYRLTDDNAPTYVAHLSTAFKQAMAGAALDIPGAKKAQVARNLWVNGERIPLYGIPQLRMDITRSADMNKTPDVRTRACMREWACVITVSFDADMMSETGVSNLLAHAGVKQGIGDWRNEKGKGTYGSFTIVDKDNPDFKRLLKTCGRSEQIKAMDNPTFYDEDTEELYEWFHGEMPLRGFNPETGEKIRSGKKDAA